VGWFFEKYIGCKTKAHVGTRGYMHKHGQEKTDWPKKSHIHEAGSFQVPGGGLIHLEVPWE